MEARVNERKRQVLDDDDIDVVYRFKVLLPNGTSIGLTVRDPDPEMPFEDFIAMVKDEYFQARKQYESMRLKKHINWKGGHFYLEDANGNKTKKMIKFESFKPHKCHILQLHVSMSCIIVLALFDCFVVVAKEREWKCWALWCT